MSVADLLDVTLSIKRKTRVEDGQGGHTESFAEVQTTPGRIGNVGGRDVAIAAQKQAIITNSVFTEPGVDIREGDQIVCEGRTYNVRVTGVEGPSYPYAKCLVERYMPHGSS